MSLTSDSAARPDRRMGPPGIYVENRSPAGPGPPQLMTGVPAFIGFANPEADILERDDIPAVVIDRWDAVRFDESIRPGDGSFLRMAVRGFFANGGGRCVLIAVPPDEGASGLLRVLQRGGPLEDRSDIDLICVPDAVSPLMQEGAGSYHVHAAALEHCEAMGDRFAILDTQEAKRISIDDVLGNASLLRSKFGALYFPWVAGDRTHDRLALAAPKASSQEWRNLARSDRGGDRHGPLIFGPPCGHVAGLFARIDGLVGPHWSPANANLEDIVDTSVHLSDRDHAQLNEGGVNCIRGLRGRGIEVAGARTRSGHSAWEFVSTARVVLGFRRWLAVAMRDLVFEPQSTFLWDRIRLRLVSHCLDLLRSGALAGPDATQAFFVKCDSETNGPDEIELGRVVALVGLAPSVPAEFIVIRVEHDPSGVTVSGLS